MFQKFVGIIQLGMFLANIFMLMGKGKPEAIKGVIPPVPAAWSFRWIPKRLSV
jgi:hypothetical protein